MNYRYGRFRCKCGRRSLIERTVNGSDHDLGLTVTCIDCIYLEDISEEFRKEQPEAVKDIEKWITEGV